jgi:putative chitinase
MTALTFDALCQRWPHANHSLTEGMVETAPLVFSKYGLTTPAEQADLMAQISEETGGGTALEENLNYSASRLCQVWPRQFPSIASALPYAYAPRALADRVYGGRSGNAPGTDDGWNFRGRGGIQVTFRDNYAMIKAVAGLDVLANPGILSAPQTFLECAAAFWKHAGLNKDADSGNFRAETLVLNGGYTNLALREQWRAIWRSELC